MDEKEAMKRDIELMKIVQKTIQKKKEIDRDKDTDTRHIQDSRKQ